METAAVAIDQQHTEAEAAALQSVSWMARHRGLTRFAAGVTLAGALAGCAEPLKSEEVTVYEAGTIADADVTAQPSVAPPAEAAPAPVAVPPAQPAPAAPAPQAAAPAPPRDTWVSKRGGPGGAGVSNDQTRLEKGKCSLPGQVDGKPGPYFEATAKAAERAIGIQPVDGEIGPADRARIVIALQAGNICDSPVALPRPEPTYFPGLTPVRGKSPMMTEAPRNPNDPRTAPLMTAVPRNPNEPAPMLTAVPDSGRPVGCGVLLPVPEACN